jgi:hypothetical protein
MILKNPVFLNLGRDRQLVFNLNTEILIRGNGADGKSVLETVGKRVNEETGAEEPILKVNPENLRIYLWAALQEDARNHKENLTLEDVGRMLGSKKLISSAVAAVMVGLQQYYGDDGQGEALAPAGE